MFEHVVYVDGQGNEFASLVVGEQDVKSVNNQDVRTVDVFVYAYGKMVNGVNNLSKTFCFKEIEKPQQPDYIQPSLILPPNPNVQ